jgi:hypothetical protein
VQVRVADGDHSAVVPPIRAADNRNEAVAIFSSGRIM